MTNLEAIEADDALLDCIGAGGIVFADSPDDELTALLIKWRDEINTPPLPSADWSQALMLAHLIRIADRPIRSRLLAYSLMAWLVGVAALAFWFAR